MEPIQKGKQTNKTSNMCASDKGKQTNKQAEAAHVEARMQGAVQSCVTCGVRYAMCQSMQKSFGDASEMCQKSMESNTQGHTLTHMKSLLILQIFHKLSNVSCGSDLNSGTQRSIVGNSPLISSLYSLSSHYSWLQLCSGCNVWFRCP